MIAVNDLLSLSLEVTEQLGCYESTQDQKDKDINCCWDNDKTLLNKALLRPFISLQYKSSEEKQIMNTYFLEEKQTQSDY